MTAPSYTYKGRVVNVVDGDTLDIDVDAGFRITLRLRLRLLRLNTPEMNSKDPAVRALALQAKAFTSTQTLNRDVVIKTQKSDSFGRYLAEVFYTDVENGVPTQFNLNDLLLSLGLATPFKG